MATTVNWITGVISIARSDLTLIQSTPTEIRQLDLNAFRLELRDLEEDPDGRPWPRTHNHNTTVTVGGVTLARVIEVLEPYTITFEDGQYAVNLVGANSNVGDRVNVNQVSVRSANSAGLVDLEILISAAYQGHVVLSQVLGQSGTASPIGTFEFPSDNESDALQIAVTQGVREFIFLEDITLDNDYALGYRLTGFSPQTSIHVNPGANVLGCGIERVTISGELDGLNLLRDCSINTVTALSGFVDKCAFQGDVTLSGPTNIFECYSQKSGEGHVNIITGNHEFQVSDWHRSLGIKGMTGGTHTVEMNGGQFHLDATCTGGTVYLRGSYSQSPDDQSNGTILVDQTIAEKIFDIHGQVRREIHIDTESLVNGNGYQQTPYNNWSDAVDDAEANGIRHLVLLADATVDRQLKNFTIEGIGTPTIDCNGQNLDKSEISRCSVTGQYTGRVVIQESNLIGTVTLNGFFQNCAISSNLLIPDGGKALVKDCSAFVEGQTLPIFDVGGISGTGILIVGGYSGGINVINVNQATDDVKIAGISGRVVLDPSDTDGTIAFIGISQFDINGATSTITALPMNPSNLRDIWQFKGCDPDKSIARSGVGTDTETITVDGKVITFTEADIVRT